MRANLANRIRRLETRQVAITESRINVSFGRLKTLPRGYVGERHIVEVDRQSSERAAYEERPGSGPDIVGDPNTLFVMFVGGPDAAASASV